MTGAVLAAQPQYERLRMVMGESDGALSTSIEEALHARGVRHLISCTKTDQLFDSLDAEIVDVLMYDYDLLGIEFAEIMQRIRRKARGKNPFVVIIATIRDSAAETVQRLIGAGVDHLMRQPLEIDRLFESFDTFTQERKPFFVSYNYVGPTRRTGHRAVEPANQIIRIPNTLRSRTIEMVSDAELERIVDHAVRGLDEKQLESCGIEIDVLATRVADGFGTGEIREDMQDVRGSLYRIEVVADELRRRARGTQFERVSELATMVIALTQRVLRAPVGSTPIEVQLLTKLSTAIRRALSVERHSVEVMKEISRTIADYTRSHRPS